MIHLSESLPNQRMCLNFENYKKCFDLINLFGLTFYGNIFLLHFSNFRDHNERAHISHHQVWYLPQLELYHDICLIIHLL